MKKQGQQALALPLHALPHSFSLPSDSRWGCHGWPTCNPITKPDNLAVVAAIFACSLNALLLQASWG